MERPTERILILGAAGRDFHNFNVLYRACEPCYEVVGFTATQIPNIDARTYPPELAGPRYPRGLPIWPEDDLERVIAEERVDRCLLAYSDLHDTKVMELAARCLTAGAEFFLVPPAATMVPSAKPVIAVCAVRTGCGKSQVSRYVVQALRRHGLRAAVVRHPMPYGDLAAQAVQRFERYEDLAAAEVTVEEREEYEQHLKAGTLVFAGVDYEAILRAAEAECDVVIWDGGNNDTPFFRPDLWVCVADPHRAGNELTYHPGDINFRAAAVIVVNKANTAPPGTVDAILRNAQRVNPAARVYITNSEIQLDAPDLVAGKRVLIVEDGPTLTHGNMAAGAGHFACLKYSAEAVDPRPYLKGSLAATFRKFPHLGKVLPAMGYWPEQVRDLEATINAVPCDAVVIATPFDLRRLVRVDRPAAVVTYGVEDREPPLLSEEVDRFVAEVVAKKKAEAGEAADADK